MSSLHSHDSGQVDSILALRPFKDKADCVRQVKGFAAAKARHPLLAWRIPGISDRSSVVGAYYKQVLKHGFSNSIFI